jgi:hypothetical protein
MARLAAVAVAVALTVVSEALFLVAAPAPGEPILADRRSPRPPPDRLRARIVVAAAFAKASAVIVAEA